MAEEKTLVLTKEGVTTLSTAILQAANTRITERIVSEVGAEDETHVPSAKAVSEAIASALGEVESNCKCEPLQEGDIQSAVQAAVEASKPSDLTE